MKATIYEQISQDAYSHPIPEAIADYMLNGENAADLSKAIVAEIDKLITPCAVDKTDEVDANADVIDDTNTKIPKKNADNEYCWISDKWTVIKDASYTGTHYYWHRDFDDMRITVNARIAYGDNHFGVFTVEIRKTEGAGGEIIRKDSECILAYVELKGIAKKHNGRTPAYSSAFYHEYDFDYATDANDYIKDVLNLNIQHSFSKSDRWNLWKSFKYFANTREDNKMKAEEWSLFNGIDRDETAGTLDEGNDNSAAEAVIDSVIENTTQADEITQDNSEAANAPAENAPVNTVNNAPANAANNADNSAIKIVREYKSQETGVGADLKIGRIFATDIFNAPHGTKLERICLGKSWSNRVYTFSTIGDREIELHSQMLVAEGIMIFDAKDFVIRHDYKFRMQMEDSIDSVSYWVVEYPEGYVPVSGLNANDTANDVEVDAAPASETATVDTTPANDTSTTENAASADNSEKAAVSEFTTADAGVEWYKGKATSLSNDDCRRELAKICKKAPVGTMYEIIRPNGNFLYTVVAYNDAKTGMLVQDVNGKRREYYITEIAYMLDVNTSVVMKYPAKETPMKKPQIKQETTPVNAPVKTVDNAPLANPAPQIPATPKITTPVITPEATPAQSIKPEATPKIKQDVKPVTTPVNAPVTTPAVDENIAAIAEAIAKTAPKKIPQNILDFVAKYGLTLKTRDSGKYAGLAEWCLDEKRNYNHTPITRTIAAELFLARYTGNGPAITPAKPAKKPKIKQETTPVNAPLANPAPQIPATTPAEDILQRFNDDETAPAENAPVKTVDNPVNNSAVDELNAKIAALMKKKQDIATETNHANKERNDLLIQKADVEEKLKANEVKQQLLIERDEECSARIDEYIRVIEKIESQLATINAGTDVEVNTADNAPADAANNADNPVDDSNTVVVDAANIASDTTALDAAEPPVKIDSATATIDASTDVEVVDNSDTTVVDAANDTADNPVDNPVDAAPASEIATVDTTVESTELSMQLDDWQAMLDDAIAEQDKIKAEFAANEKQFKEYTAELAVIVDKINAADAKIENYNAMATECDKQLAELQAQLAALTGNNTNA